MECHTQPLLNILPLSWRGDLSGDVLCTATELRLRLEQPAELVRGLDYTRLPFLVSRQDIRFVLNAASQYSPWTSHTAAQGYITVPGGHRIGICGSVNAPQDTVTGIQTPTSLCIRIAKDKPGLGARFIPSSSTLILGAPGSGKTTLLRDIIRQLSQTQTVCVVDERREIFPTANDRFCFPVGKRTDVLSGCSKSQGTHMVLRSMGPQWIAMDEITSAQDTQALLECAWCGVRLLATAHADCLEDLQNRPVYRPLWDSGIFSQVLVFSGDKPYIPERRSVSCSNGLARC